MPIAPSLMAVASGVVKNSPPSHRLVELFEYQWERIVRRVLAHEDIEVAVFGNDPERVVARPVTIDVAKAPLLALGQEAVVLLAGDERHSGRGLRLDRREVA